MALPPLVQYQLETQQTDFYFDEDQFQVVLQLQASFECYCQSPPRWRWPWKGRMPKPKGIYLWGEVGRGKSHLMDNLYHALPIAKQRFHYHRLMQQVHHRLQSLKGHKNPLQRVAQELSRECQILCLDEFMVTDITDAMLLGGLLRHLFEQGVIVLATSNLPPEQLYQNGLQRERFLPAIQLLQEHCQVLELCAQTDYRLRQLASEHCFVIPNTVEANDSLRARFVHLAPEPVQEEAPLLLQQRVVTSIGVAGDVVMFDFKTLCQSARSTLDYIELSQLFHTLVLLDVPQMNESQNDAARRFIALIDELYERKVKLLMSAEAKPALLYSGRQLAFAFERCVSRLEEMQSEYYLSLPHLPG